MLVAGRVRGGVCISRRTARAQFNSLLRHGRQRCQPRVRVCGIHHTLQRCRKRGVSAARGLECGTHIAHKCSTAAHAPRQKCCCAARSAGGGMDANMRMGACGSVDSADGRGSRGSVAASAPSFDARRARWRSSDGESADCSTRARDHVRGASAPPSAHESRVRQGADARGGSSGAHPRWRAAARPPSCCWRTACFLPRRAPCGTARAPG